MLAPLFSIVVSRRQGSGWPAVSKRRWRSTRGAFIPNEFKNLHRRLSAPDLLPRRVRGEVSIGGFDPPQRVPTTLFNWYSHNFLRSLPRHSERLQFLPYPRRIPASISPEIFNFSLRQPHTWIAEFTNGLIPPPNVFPKIDISISQGPMDIMMYLVSCPCHPFLGGALFFC